MRTRLLFLILGSFCACGTSANTFDGTPPNAAAGGRAPSDDASLGMGGSSVGRSGAGGGTGIGGSPIDSGTHDDATPRADGPGSAVGDSSRTADAPRIDASRPDVGARDATALPGCDTPTAHARADAALDSMLSGFWNTTSRYLDNAPGSGKATGYWTFAQGFDALLDGVERTMGRKYSTSIATFYAGQNAKGWSSNYYDDETWMVLALTRAYDLTNNQPYLDRAVTLYRDIIAAWDGTSVSPGGIWWDRAHTQKATASNAGPVIAGARLAARTGDTTHLAFAQKVYAFWFMKMVDPATYKLADHILPDGTIARGLLTYNEGLMLGAAHALYIATGNAKFLADAHGIAHALVTNETKSTSLGPVLTDGTNTGCTGDCPQWKGIAYRYLALLFAADLQHTEYRATLDASVESAWTLARSPSTSYFANDWRGPSTTAASIEAMSSTAMALSLHASLCGPYTGD